jgi:hypothetical protein
MPLLSMFGGQKTDQELYKVTICNLITLPVPRNLMNILSQNCIATLSQKFDAYEKILSKQKYLAGDVSGSRLHGVPLQPLPLRKSRWLTFSTFRTVPYWRSVVVI